MGSIELYENIKKKLQIELDELTVLTKQSDVKLSSGEDRQRFECEIERKSSQINILIKDLELQVYQVAMSHRPKMNREVKRLKYELDNIQRSLKNKHSSHFKVTYGLGNSSNPANFRIHEAGDQSNILLGHKSLQQASESIARSNVVAVESEDVGFDVLDNLDQQKEQLLRTRDRLEDTHEELSRSRKILQAINKNVVYNKIFLIFLIVAELGILGGVIYLRHIKKT